MWAWLYSWTFGWFTASNAERLGNIVGDMTMIFRQLSPLVRQAEPIVERIDAELKPQLKDPQSDKAMVLINFLNSFMPTEQVPSTVESLLDQALPDLLRDVAIAILMQTLSNPVSKSALRLTIEAAYQLYQWRKSK